MPIMAKSNDEYAEVKAIKTPDGTEIDYVLSKVNNTYKRTYTATRELEGTPPLEFKSIKPNANLIDYRIHGQTSRNLFDETNGVVTDTFIKGDGTTDIGANGDKFICNRINVLPNTTYTFSWGKMVLGTNDNTPYIRVAQYDSNGNFLSRILVAANNFPNNRWVTTVGNDVRLWDIRIDDTSSTRGQHLEEVMLNSGSTPLPYEPYGESVGDLVTSGEHAGEYKVPVTVSNGTDALTTPIYFPEQIKKVGDEAEYMDYATQKWHRVRKNLLQNTATSQTINGVTFTVNSDGSVTCNGTASTTVIYIISSKAFSLPVGRYKLNGAPTGGGQDYNFKLDVRVSTKTYYPDTGNGIRFNILQGESITMCRIVIYSGYTCDNLTFYPMIRLATIEDDTYEPYIENTDLDVTLPALPTLTGTNVLSVGTEVQPSDMYIKGNFKMIAGGGE